MNVYEFTVAGEKLEVKLTGNGESSTVKIGEEELRVRQLDENTFIVYMNEKRIPVAAVRDKAYTLVEIDSAVYEVRETLSNDINGTGDEETGAKDKIYAPMPGKIVKLLVEVGQTVEPKQQVVIVEAMKMENPVLSQAKGVVKAVNYSVGDQVDTDSPIIELELDE